MTLVKLLEGLNVLSTNADLNIEVSDIKIHSQSVDDGDVFICMKGVKDDGNKYLNQIKKFFVAVTEDIPNDKSIKYVQVEDVRKAYAIISSNYFACPIDGMKFIAIVGTNGKTSTAHYINSILATCGYKTGLIGTEGHYILGEKVAHNLTTPDPYELNSLLFKMRAKGVEIVISEVSAHAIFLKKVCGIMADIAVLTNISQDHLDFFKDYHTYEQVKLGYFTEDNIKKAIVNIDDPAGKRLASTLEKSNVGLVTYGLNNPADCFAIDLYEGIDGIHFVANLCDDLVDIRSSLYGEFNIYNLLATLAVCSELGIHGEELARAVRRVKNVKGRFSVLRAEKGTIIIDYAHTPDGLQQLLSTARTITKSRLITVFGCGGERDSAKRALMGEIAENYSDYVVVTTDNPRGENVETILHDIEMGFAGRNYKCIPDRTEAIIHAIGEMIEGDTVVIAGKGNEEYLEIKGKKIPYSDFDIAKRWGQAK
ncbi:MAG: UDP-N-acetylmuramoyl-L-alanyl-D-glutamate--2,6-diaminopimelate ligase [Clostridia bacterium]|nr:UDP-N-acetylmuramoyl-L-alanyl-D-glutamate--2,6-diaminopimelate ligase [Clostridia bacterium]